MDKRMKHTRDIPQIWMQSHAAIDWQLCWWMVCLLDANYRVHFHAPLVLPLRATRWFSTRRLFGRPCCPWGSFRVHQWLWLWGRGCWRRHGISCWSLLSLTDCLCLFLLLLFLFESYKDSKESLFNLLGMETSPSRHSFSSGTKCSNSISSSADNTSVALSVLRLPFNAKLLALWTWDTV